MEIVWEIHALEQNLYHWGIDNQHALKTTWRHFLVKSTT